MNLAHQRMYQTARRDFLQRELLQREERLLSPMQRELLQREERLRELRPPMTAMERDILQQEERLRELHLLCDPSSA